MANIVCAKSSLIFNCEHLPVSLSGREVTHPMFYIPQKKLISLAGNWAAGKLSPTESYLLYLSLLDSTELIEWRAPAKFHSKTLQIVSNNIEALLHIVGKINLITHPSFTLPKFSITSDTCGLENTHYYIEAWINNYNDWMDGYKHSSLEERQRLESREHALEKLIKTPYTSIRQGESKESLVHALAEWAVLAGNFPSGLVPHHRSRKMMPLSEYWKLIIKAAINEEKLWEFPRSEIADLIDHCEDNIIHGSVHAHALMKVLREGLKKYDDYLGFGDIDLAGRTTSFTILGSTNSAEDANIKAMIQSAPSEEPKQDQYPTKFAYLKAKSKWMVAQMHAGAK